MSRHQLVLAMIVLGTNAASGQIRPGNPVVIPTAPAPKTPQTTPPTDLPAGQMGQISGTMRLSKHPEAQQILSEIASRFDGLSINVALLAGQEYSAGNCLALKVRSGTFAMQLTPPSFAIDGTGISFTFAIPHVEMTGIKLRVKPNPGPEPCTFGGLVNVGGSASDIRFMYKMDPIVALKECSMVRMNPAVEGAKWSIGGMNLKPLQNDLDKAAKKMLEASLNMLSGSYLGPLFERQVEEVLELHPKCIP